MGILTREEALVDNLCLNSPPIREAIIDVGFVNPKSIDQLKLVSQDLLQDYPQVQDRFAWVGQVEFHPTASMPKTSTQSMQDGFMLRAENGLDMIQLRMHGFTSSRLAPYEDWDRLAKRSKKAWKSLVDKVDGVQVNKLAIRYINDIRFPAGESVFKYLNIRAGLATSLPQEYAGFLLHWKCLFHDPFAQAQINVSMEPSQSGEYSSVIFDIEVFRVFTQYPENTDIWGYLDEFRTIKNRIFFETMTKTAKEMYE